MEFPHDMFLTLCVYLFQASDSDDEMSEDNSEFQPESNEEEESSDYESSEDESLVDSESGDIEEDSDENEDEEGLTWDQLEEEAKRCTFVVNTQLGCL